MTSLEQSGALEAVQSNEDIQFSPEPSVADAFFRDFREAMTETRGYLKQKVAVRLMSNRAGSNVRL